MRNAYFSSSDLLVYFVSLLLNLVTGGAIITNYIDPTDRSDSQPYQALHLHLVTPHTYCNVGHLLMFNLLIVQLVKIYLDFNLLINKTNQRLSNEYQGIFIMTTCEPPVLKLRRQLQLLS